jgi:hypothetical protein
MRTTTELLEWVNRIRWREQETVTPEAMSLIECHRERIQRVTQFLRKRQPTLLPAEAHGMALTPAHDTAEYGRVLDALFEQGDFAQAQVREPIIMTIAACEAWSLDPQLSTLPNPWEPVIGLYASGYPTSYVDSQDHQSVHLRVGLRDETRDFVVL